MESITAIAQAINEGAKRHRIGQLQELRKQMKGLKSVRSVIFDKSKRSVNETEGWAFHTGGREELQFNIGIERHANRFRFGVAFSLEPSRSLPDIAPLLPKIERFNEYTRNNSSDFASFRMWIWRNATIVKSDTAVRQITEDEIKVPNFIFLGKAVPINSIDVSEVLETFDQLLPLYGFVEAASLEPGWTPRPGDWPPFQFREGVKLSDIDTSVRQAQGEIDVVLRSKQIMRQLLKQLRNQMRIKLGSEIPSGNGGKIDLVGLLPSGEYDFYEIKPALLARHAIREALPQLLEYAYRKGGHQARRLLIVSQAPLDHDSDNFLNTLRAKGLPIFYEQIVLA
jgi:hypothetical protein